MLGRRVIPSSEGLRTLVPRVVGQTAAAETRKGSRDKRPWDEESLLRELEATYARRGEAKLRHAHPSRGRRAADRLRGERGRPPAEATVARELIEWAPVQRLRPWWGTGKGGFGPVLDHAGQTYYPFGVSSRSRSPSST
jgi:hypothetical protein